MTNIGINLTMEKPTTQGNKLLKKREVKHNTIYSRSIITRSVVIPITNIAKNIKDILEKHIIANYEGKCVVEGYIKPGSVKIITYSSGRVEGINIRFEIVFESYICSPVEGMLISCVAKNITKAGIRGESAEETPSPIVVFVTRDHHYMNKKFNAIAEGDKFIARIIGQRFELNDKYVSIIAELVSSELFVQNTQTTKKPKLKIEN